MLTAYAGDHRLADRVRTYLTRQIHLHRRVDRHRLRVLPDDLRVVRPRHIADHKIAVPVHVFIEVLRSQDQTAHRLARQHFLQAVIDHAFLDQRQHTVRDRLRMQAQMLMVLQRVDHGIRDAAHADLQRRPVRYLRGHVVTYLRLDRVRHRRWHLNQRHIAPAHRRDLTHMDHRVAKRPRHVFVYLRDHHAGALRARESDIGRYAEGAVALLVRLTHVQEGHIHRDLPAPEQERHFA